MYGCHNWNTGPINAAPGGWQGFDGFNEFECYDWNTRQGGSMTPWGSEAWMGMHPASMMNVWNAMRSWHQPGPWMNGNPWAFMYQWNPMNMNQWWNMNHWWNMAPGAGAAPDWNRSSWKSTSGFTGCAPTGFGGTVGFGGGSPPAEAA